MEKRQIVRLIEILGKIKNLRRRGWIKRNVFEPESDADHMYSIALQVLLLTPQHLDKLHCLELALTHDLQEIYASDFVPGEIDAEQKIALEMQAVNQIASELEFPQLLEWFREFENQSSPEARFVKCLDKTDNILTAAYYEQNKRTNYNLLDEFAPYALQCIEKIETKDKSICTNIINHIWKGKKDV